MAWVWLRFSDEAGARLRWPVKSGSNEKTGAQHWKQMSKRQSGVQHSHKEGMTRKTRKTMFYESDSLCSAHVCLMEMVVFSYWRWVWLTSSIRSVTEVWRAALPWYWDRRAQAAICCYFFFFLFSLITWESQALNTSSLTRCLPRSTGCAAPGSLGKQGLLAFFSEK